MANFDAKVKAAFKKAATLEGYKVLVAVSSPKSKINKQNPEYVIGVNISQTDKVQEFLKLGFTSSTKVSKIYVYEGKEIEDVYYRKEFTR